MSDWERKAYEDLLKAGQMMVTADETSVTPRNRCMTFEEWSGLMQKMGHEENGGSVQ